MSKDIIKNIRIGHSRIGGQPIPDALPLEVETYIQALQAKIKELGIELEELRNSEFKIAMVTQGDKVLDIKKTVITSVGLRVYVI